MLENLVFSKSRMLILYSFEIPQLFKFCPFRFRYDSLQIEKIKSSKYDIKK